jgi:thiosulfate/3-mercaptopyruvate sulfurtransferase
MDVMRFSDAFRASWKNCDEYGGMRVSEEYARADVLVDTAWLREHLDDPEVRVVEVDVSPAAYTQGHIPGAVLWNVYKDLKTAEYQLVDRAAVEKLIQQSGIDVKSIVVFYGYAPTMGYWLMKLYGHPQVRVLNASRDTWQREGRPWTAAVSAPTVTSYHLSAQNERIRADQSMVRGAIDATGRIIVDVRTEPEYRGERFWPSGAMEEGGRAGHIPSALHVPGDGILDENGAFLPAEALEQHFADLHPEAGGEVISYCTIGGRACTAWFILSQLLGHEEARVYDGSWAEWGRAASTPVSID